jgi:hypothetical protein
MSTIIKYCDLFGKNVTLYSKSSSKITTCVGLFFTILTLLIFSLIFYFESYEAFKREHPNVVSYKQNLNKNNSTLSVNNNTFNFFIHLRPTFPIYQITNFLQITAEIKFGDDSDAQKVSFEQCNENDKAIFSTLLNKELAFEERGISYCPRIDFTKTETKTSFSNVEFSFNLGECDGKTESHCEPNYNLYDYLRKGIEYNITANLYFVDSQIDLTDSANPYTFNMKAFKTISSWKKHNIVNLEGSEIRTQSFFNFNRYEKQSRLSFSTTETSVNEDQRCFLSYSFAFNSKDMYIYNRTYKTVNSAFANSFAIFKLIKWFFSILLAPYYTYYKNLNIIGKNFFFNDETQSNSGIKKTAINLSSDSSIELTGNRKSKKLTTLSIIRNASLMRYILCTKRNKVKKFYDQAKFAIGYNLSVENLLTFMVEYFRLKHFLLEEDKDVGRFNSSKRKLTLNEHLKVSKEDLRLDVLINNSDNKTRLNDNFVDDVNK